MQTFLAEFRNILPRFNNLLKVTAYIYELLKDEIHAHHFLRDDKYSSCK